LIERDHDVALGGEVIDLVWFDCPDEPGELRPVGQIPVVEHQRDPLLVRVVVEMIDPVCVERRSAADDPVYFVALAEQELGQIGAILAGDAADQRLLQTSNSSCFDRGYTMD